MTDFRHKTYHRNLLEKFLKEHAHLIKGEILDIGSKNRRYDSWFSGRITAVDLEPNPSANVLPGNIERGLNLSDQSFDNIICLEVFEYLENHQKAVTEIYRLLKSGGHALVSMPFMYPEHQDNIRFTKKYLLTQFTQFSSVEIKTIGNAYTTIWDILRKKWFLGKKSPAAKIIWWSILQPLLGIIRQPAVESITDNYYSGLFIILQK